MSLPIAREAAAIEEDLPTETTPLNAGHDGAPVSLQPSISRQIYVSHLLSTWNFRGFEFGTVLFLAKIFPGTLLPMSVYALVRAASSIVLAPAVGQYIDRGNRLSVVRTSIVWQRLAVVLSCGLLLVMLLRGRSLTGDWTTIALFSSATALACVERTCSTMNTIAVERDWVVVIAGGNDAALRQLNSQMRRIDLLCKLLSPLVIALLDGLSTKLAIITTLAINAVSMLVEYGLIARVYTVVPALAEPKPSSPGASPAAVGGEGSHGASLTRRLRRPLTLALENTKIYVSQPPFLASLSLSILYLTVLSFAGQMVTFLLAMGYTSELVGIVRVGSSIFELSATWMAPWLMKRIGPVRSGIWFLSFQMICLGAGVCAYLNISSPFGAASALVAATALSRIGLWGFDLSAQVTIQEGVQAEYRGAFSTTEAALQSFFELCAYSSTVIFYKPSEFKYPMIMSIAAVYTAGGLYAKFVRDRRGHLIHLPSFMTERGTL